MALDKVVGRTLVACALLLVAPLVVVPATAAEEAPEKLVRVQKAMVYLSPDGDGRRDVARIAFDLTKPARVSLEVRPQFSVEGGRVRLGHLGEGRHYWTFDGRVGGGVAPGVWSIRIRATRGDVVDRALVRAWVDTTPDEGTLLVSRPTVYPAADAVDDRVLVTYLREGWNTQQAVYPDDSAGFGPRIPLRVHLFVLDGQGRRVHRDTERTAYTPVLSWDGTTGGKPAAPGTYSVRVFVADAAGNTSSYHETVRVSHRQLRQVTSSTTVTADQAAQYHVPTPAGCPGCGFGCSPVGSERYVGGLSFRPCTAYPNGAPSFADFTIPVPFAAAPTDEYRVAATGGPTDPASAAVGSLDGVPMGPGDATAWTEWAPVDLSVPPYLPTQATPLGWHFQTDGGSAYDVASFTVEYRRWVPVR